MRLSPRRNWGRSGTVHLVRFAIDDIVESYCGSSRTDIYGYTKDKDKATCLACLNVAAKREVYNGE